MTHWWVIIMTVRRIYDQGRIESDIKMNLEIKRNDSWQYESYCMTHNEEIEFCFSSLNLARLQIPLIWLDLPPGTMTSFKHDDVIRLPGAKSGLIRPQSVNLQRKGKQRKMVIFTCRRWLIGDDDSSVWMSHREASKLFNYDSLSIHGRARVDLDQTRLGWMRGSNHHAKIAENNFINRK
jgi:hypothetical protein